MEVNYEKKDRIYVINSNVDWWIINDFYAGN